MATVKVKLRPSSVVGKAGTIYYQLTHLRKVKQITTKIHLLPDRWDADHARILSNDWAAYLNQQKISNDLERLQHIIHRLEAERVDYTVEDIVSKFHQMLPDYTITEFFTQQIQRLTDCNKQGTARNYRKTLNSLVHFLKGADPSFSAVTESFVEDYHTYLIKRKVVRNTLSFYMRMFRAVYNKAVAHHLVEQTFPFRNMYTGVDQTRKRAVADTVISRLLTLDLEKSRSLQFARDLFFFSFYTRGMAFVDMAYLKKTNIQNGYIVYMRHKTAQELCIKIEPSLYEIINRYQTASSLYVFPILTTDDPGRAYTQYEVALNYYNRQLKRLAEYLGPDITLSSYTPRHSWATVARNQHVPMAVISASMGHTSERTTRIYLMNLENSVIDEVNKAIIESIK